MAKRELVVGMLLNDDKMRTRDCKTLKHCWKELEMLLEDDETQTLARKTFKRCSKTSWLQNDSYPRTAARLLKYYPRQPCAPSLIKSILQIYLEYLLSYILKFLICIHAGNPRVPPRVLACGPKPCGDNNRTVILTEFFEGLENSSSTKINSVQ